MFKILPFGGVKAAAEERKAELEELLRLNRGYSGRRHFFLTTTVSSLTLEDDD